MQSFYRKAFVLINDNGVEILYSYDVPIMAKLTDGEFVRLYEGWTMTTGRHIYAFSGMRKKQFESMEVGKYECL